MKGRGWWFSGGSESCPNRKDLGRVNQGCEAGSQNSLFDHFRCTINATTCVATIEGDHSHQTERLITICVNGHRQVNVCSSLTPRRGRN